MSSAFSDIPRDYLNEDISNELLLAHFEREKAKSLSPYRALSFVYSTEDLDEWTYDLAPGGGPILLTAGGNISAGFGTLGDTDFSFFGRLQEDAEIYPPKYINHVGHSPGDFDGETSIPAFTLAALFAEAALNANGWRRATAYDPDTNDWQDPNDGMYSYGFASPSYESMLDGDILGPWLIADLREGFSAMKWTFINAGTTNPPSITVDVTRPCALDIYWKETGDDTLHFHETLAEAQTSPRDGSEITPSEEKSITAIWVVARWNFTNSN